MKPMFLPRYWLVKTAFYCPNTSCAESPLGMYILPTGYEQEPATTFHETPGSNRPLLLDHTRGTQAGNTDNPNHVVKLRETLWACIEHNL